MTHFVTRTYQDRGETVSNKETVQGNGEATFDQPIAFGTDVHYDFRVKRAELLSLSFLADQDCTIGTNGTVFGSPPTKTDTIVLKGGREYVWTLDQDGLTGGPALVTCPISADITTGIYITALVSPPSSTRVRIKALLSI